MSGPQLWGIETVRDAPSPSSAPGDQARRAEPMPAAPASHPRGNRRRGAPKGWTATSTLMACAAAIVAYTLLTEGWRLGGGWQAVVLAICIGVLAGGLWRQAFMLGLGGGAALLFHRGLLADLPADAAIWPPVLAAAAAGLVVLCIWRVLAVAMIVVATLAMLRLTYEGVAPAMILDAIRMHL